MERLNGIKDVVENNKRFNIGQTMLLKIDDVDWLIEQAEELQKLEKKYVEVLEQSSNRLGKLIEIQHILDK